MNIKEIEQIISKDKIYVNETMSKHTSFKIGGPAECLVKIGTIEELKNILKYAKQNQIPITIIGNGSNLLVNDEGIKGIVLKIEIKKLEIQEEGEKVQIVVGSGNKLGETALKLVRQEISGLEFAAGIPGTIGGAIRMNAGAHGSEMKDIVKTITYMDKDGIIHKIRKR